MIDLALYQEVYPVLPLLLIVPDWVQCQLGGGYGGGQWPLSGECHAGGVVSYEATIAQVLIPWDNVS